MMDALLQQPCGTWVLWAFSIVGAGVWAGVAVLGLLKLRSLWRQRGERDIDGAFIVVTGADSGLGQASMQTLVRRGARVVACCYTDDGATAALDAGAVWAPVVDFTDESAVGALARQVDDLCGGSLTAVVHSAGIALPGFVDYQPLSFFRRVMEVNFFAAVHLTQRWLPALRRARGRVVLVSSVDGLVSLPGNAPYDASKFAVEAYADALRVELDDAGVVVSVVNPATMKTPLAMQFFEQHRVAWDEQQKLDPDGSWQVHYPRSWLDAYVDLNTAHLERIAQDPQHAVDDIVHAVCAKHPRPRYLSGTLAKTLFYALWVGPESFAHAFKKASIQPPSPSTTSGGSV